MSCVIFFTSGIFCGQPTLRPSTHYSCPNEIVTFTCHGSQVKNIQWIVEPCIPETDPIIFAVDQTTTSEGNEPLNRTQVFSATLINVTNKSGNDTIGWRADMTITLTVNTTDDVNNKTNITCRAQIGIDFFSNSAFLYIAGWGSSSCAMIISYWLNMHVF